MLSWWTAMMITTVGTDYFPVTVEGRSLACVVSLSHPPGRWIGRTEVGELMPLRSRSRLKIHSLVVVLLVLAAGCSQGPSAEQLEWCALNQAEVGRSALELGVFDEAVTFGEWKESKPDSYTRACGHAFQRSAPH